MLMYSVYKRGFRIAANKLRTLVILLEKFVIRSVIFHLIETIPSQIGVFTKKIFCNALNTIKNVDFC